MRERLYGVVAVIVLIALVAAGVALYMGGKKTEKILEAYPTGDPTRDKQLNDSITPVTLTAAGLSESNTELVNKVDANGWAPLHWAAARDHVNVAKLLLAQKAKVDAADRAGSTALHWAAANGSADVVKVLIAHHADVNAQNANGTTPLTLAEKAGHKEVATILSQRGGMD